MQIHFFRHATLIVRLKGLAVLVDPMLAQAGAAPPVANTPNPRRNPLVDLPFEAEALRRQLDQLDAVIVTHTHSDHWDARARELLRKDLPLFCQPEDAERIRGGGFSAVHPVETEYDWQGIRFARTGGRHGTGEIGRLMGPVSGFVLEAAGEPRLYIAGDTIWCPEVEAVLRDRQPHAALVNAGAAQFQTGDPITMTAEDVERVAASLEDGMVIAVHMEAVNHCLLTRAALRKHLQRAGLSARVRIPEDGEKIQL